MKRKLKLKNLTKSRQVLLRKLTKETSLKRKFTKETSLKRKFTKETLVSFVF